MGKMIEMEKTEETNHTFAVCAYKESPYLKECLESLVNQTVKTNIIIATSTPNEYIDKLAEKYGIKVYVNKGETGITQDWNFAYMSADTEYVTITHQDDVYDKEYVKNLLEYMKAGKKPLIYFTDYAEIREKQIVKTNTLLRIKRVMLFPLRFKIFWKSRWVRRRILSLGTPICCPSVSFAKSNLPETVFNNGFRADEDWETWENLSRYKGSFIFCNKILTYHRIHQESETTKILSESKRGEEDFIMFCKFWPKPVAKMLTKLYGKSENSNNMEDDKNEKNSD